MINKLRYIDKSIEIINCVIGHYFFDFKILNYYSGGT